MEGLSMDTVENATPQADGPARVIPPSLVRHGDDEWIDEIRLRTVPRFKESGLSGDEWRTSVTIEYLRKGHVLFTTSNHRLTWAVASLAKHATGLHPGDFPYDRIDHDLERSLDRDFCFQPGCSEPWAVEYRLTARGCGRCGHTHEPPGDYRRRFCSRHATRGDSNLDDMDARYVLAATRAVDGTVTEAVTA